MGFCLMYTASGIAMETLEELNALQEKLKITGEEFSSRNKSIEMQKNNLQTQIDDLKTLMEANQNTKQNVMKEMEALLLATKIDTHKKDTVSAESKLKKKLCNAIYRNNESVIKQILYLDIRLKDLKTMCTQSGCAQIDEMCSDINTVRDSTRVITHSITELISVLGIMPKSDGSSSDSNSSSDGE